VGKLSGKKGAGVGVLAITKAVKAATKNKSKKLQASVRIALNGLVRSGALVLLAKKKYKLAKDARKKKPTTTTKKKKAPIKAGPTAAKKKRKTATTKTAAVATPTKKKAKKKIAPEAAPEGGPAVMGEPALKKKKSKTSLADEPHWEYFDRSWRPYVKDASDVVEAAFQEYLRDPGMLDVRSVKSGSWAYQVDFVNMKQTNIEHANHTVRDIRRIPPIAPAPAAPSAK
jgi:hypothetical protein